MQRTIGRGGMATVFLARDRKLERDVAIKVLHPEVASAVSAERFLREVRIAASLRHPNIVALFDSGTADELPYYVMPYVEGQSLRDRLNDEGRLPVDDALRIARDVSEALSHAHAQGVVHRDIKPENILLAGYRPRAGTTPSGGGGWHAQVADFGIACGALINQGPTGSSFSPLTEVGVILGTPHYMSPEQTSGVVEVDGRTDQYALGCVLYEMLAGNPPFAGSNAGVLFAQHATQAPPGVRAVRPEVPRAVERAIRRAMAKHPADRFASADDFIAALDPSGSGPRDWVPPLAPRRWRTTALAVAGAVAVALAAAALLVGGERAARLPANAAAPLDSTRIMVFAPRPADGRPDDGAGESVASLIGYALDGTAPLTWLRGSDWLDGRQPGARVMEEISRAHRAAFYVDGTVVRQRDSTTVMLVLHQVGTDAPLARADASGRDGEVTAPLLGLRAVGELLVPLLARERRVDVSALAQRRPAAIANFLQADGAYRDGRFARALELYGAAVAADSDFALAAVKGSWAAAWLGRTDDASAMADAALRRARLLPPRYAELALGSTRLVAGDADSAAAAFRRALAIDPRWAEGWMGLGEVYTHLLPSAGAPPDSLAAAAFEQARRNDPGFSPPLYHLAEIALRQGAPGEAERLTREARAAVGASPDSGPLPRLELALRCAREGPGAMDWRSRLRDGQGDVEAVGKILAAGPAHAACARSAFWAVIADPGSPRKWGPTIGLFGLLAAAGRADDAVAFSRTPPAAAMRAGMLTLVAAAAYGDAPPPALAAAAADAARELGEDYARMNAPQLWLLAGWEGRGGGGGRADAARAIARALAAKADSTHARRDSLLAAAAAARAALAGGDTSGAMRRLQALRPTAPFGGLQWDLWEPLGGEHLVLARLHLARKEYRAAVEVASRLDGPEPIAFLFHLRPSLQLRLRAAEAMGDVALAARCRARLAALDADHAPVPWAAHPLAEGGKDGTSR